MLLFSISYPTNQQRFTIAQTAPQEQFIALPPAGHLHFAVTVFGARFDDLDLVGSEGEEGIDAGVEFGFESDDLRRALLMLGLPR
jgi:hypothetical protein